MKIERFQFPFPVTLYPHNMKKYRFGDPSKSGFFRKYGNFVYFFTAWNLLGIIVWKSMSKNKSGTEEKWDEMSSSKIDHSNYSNSQSRRLLLTYFEMCMC